MNVLLISLQKDLDTIGLKHIHYSLLTNGYNSYLLYITNLRDNNRKTLNSIDVFIKNSSPAFIGISLMSHEYENAKQLTAHIKNIPVIWGGIHPTIAPETCWDHADYLCIGEGENAILEFAATIENKCSPADTKNICFKDGGKIVKNKLFPLIEDLDTVPLCDHIPRNSYIIAKGALKQMDIALFRRHARYGGASYSVMSSRGCPFSCAYCCNNYVSGLYNSRKIRRRTVQGLINELKNVTGKNPFIEYINFQDDCFLSYSEDYLNEFCDFYKNEIGLPFFAKSIPVFVTERKINALKNAGLIWFTMGLQSGSDRICKDIYKRNSLRKDFLRAVQIVKKENIAAVYDIILDNPFENEQDHFETIQTLIDTPKPFYTQIFSLNFYPGTELYEKAKKECPELMDDYFAKDYFEYGKNTINEMIKLATILSGKRMNRILELYKKSPESLKFRFLFSFSKLLSIFILEPLTYFKLIRLSFKDSASKILSFILGNLKLRLIIHLKQIFRWPEIFN